MVLDQPMAARAQGGERQIVEFVVGHDDHTLAGGQRDGLEQEIMERFRLALAGGAPA